MSDDEKLREGNRNFSFAMIALESGDFSKSERLLRDTIGMMGNSHPVSMLAMKTLGGIASEQGRVDDALQVSLDLLDAQILTFGVNHAESSRTVRSILDMCKDLGNEQIAADIATLVQVASEMEKSQTTQSMKRLRTSDLDEDVAKETLKHKIAKWLAQRLAKVFKKLPILRVGLNLAPWLLLGGLVSVYGSMHYLSLKSSAASVAEFRHSGLEYETPDGRRKLNFHTPVDVLVKLDANQTSAPYRVVGFHVNDLSILATSAILDKESWMLLEDDGLHDFRNNVYYRSDAPEIHVVHQMQEVMSTVRLYFKEKQKYPSKIEQISETSFQYQNPFTKEMVTPSIQNVRLAGQAPEVVADFVWTIKKGGTWTDEPPLQPGAIHCCRVNYDSGTEIKQQFLIHCCDRNGAVITGTDGPALVLHSDDGNDVDQKLTLTLPQRIPTIWVIKLPTKLSPEIVPLLKYRFVLLFGFLALMFFGFSVLTPDKRSRAGSVVLGLCALLTFIATVVSLNL